MDFREFRSQVVRVPFEYDGEEFWVGYRPRMILEEDIEQMAWLSRIKLDLNIDPELLAEMAAQPPNRAQRRRSEKAERIAKATPAAKARQDAKQAPSLIDFMTRFIADWSLTWDEEPWPPTEEHFKLVDPMLRAAMIGVIVADYTDRPNRMSSSKPSSAGTASGQTGQTSASEPSSGATAAADPVGASSPGI